MTNIVDERLRDWMLIFALLSEGHGGPLNGQADAISTVRRTMRPVHNERGDDGA